VCFAYSAPSHAAEYERVFGGAERFDREMTELVFPRAWLDRAQPYRSPELYAVLKEQADRSLGRIERDVPLRSRIEEILIKRAPRALTMDDVASELGISDRSLRRRLATEGLSFSDLLAQSRMSAAKRMLERPGTSIKEVAFTMEFASEAAFHRAFKRWTGMTPKQYQESF
jgi:AraC-like DNA-binding protein